MLFSKFILPALAFLVASSAVPTDVEIDAPAIAHGGPTTSSSAIAEVNTSPVALSELVAPKPDDYYASIYIICNSLIHTFSFISQSCNAGDILFAFLATFGGTIGRCQFRAATAGLTVWFTPSQKVVAQSPCANSSLVCVPAVLSPVLALWLCLPRGFNPEFNTPFLNANTGNAGTIRKVPLLDAFGLDERLVQGVYLGSSKVNSASPVGSALKFERAEGGAAPESGSDAAAQRLKNARTQERSGVEGTIKGVSFDVPREGTGARSNQMSIHASGQRRKVGIGIVIYLPCKTKTSGKSAFGFCTRSNGQGPGVEMYNSARSSSSPRQTFGCPLSTQPSASTPYCYVIAIMIKRVESRVRGAPESEFEAEGRERSGLDDGNAQEDWLALG
ncbi:hypothetical protein C8R44DRAFT_742542 [Mycena epipterygia]|nr:hypothetical protein C8R44DRAFT_742542 [Mycena epipterygia]